GVSPGKPNDHGIGRRRQQGRRPLRPTRKARAQQDARNAAMTEWIVRRIIQAVLILFAMTAIIFLAVNVIGDPVETLIPPEADHIERQRMIERFGLDRPLHEQYWTFIRGLTEGNFGTSYVYGESAIKVILDRMPATLELAFCTMIVSTLIGVPLGLYAGLRPNAWGSRLVMSGSIVGFSLPSFWTGLLL